MKRLPTKILPSDKHGRICRLKPRKETTFRNKIVRTALTSRVRKLMSVSDKPVPLNLLLQRCRYLYFCDPETLVIQDIFRGLETLLQIKVLWLNLYFVGVNDNLVANRRRHSPNPGDILLADIELMYHGIISFFALNCESMANSYMPTHNTPRASLVCWMNNTIVWPTV